MKTPILGASYKVSSVNAAADRCVNLFPEIIPAGGKDRGFLSRTPGLRPVLSLPDGPIRGVWAYGVLLYVVSGDALYEVDYGAINNGWSWRKLGNVYGTGATVSMADNGIQLFIACGMKSYIYNRNTDTLSEITDPDFPGAESVAFVDGYFVFIQPGSQKVWVTALYDGSNIDALDYASAEGFPDKIKGMIVDHREIWLIGETSCEVWYNAGGADFPLARINSAFVEMGCAAGKSIAKIDNSIFWLGSDARGGGIVLRSSGYNGQRVSDHGVEFAMSQYGTISDAEAFTYRLAGHSFYVLTFPTEGKTWVYDVATQSWHERVSYLSGELIRWRARCAVNFRGRVLVGDYKTGDLYELDGSYFLDGDQPIPWVRAWRALPQGQNNLKRTFHRYLQVDIEAGVGLSVGQGSNPVVSLRWSDDGGHTWSNYHQKEMGGIGEYGRKVIWRRLGATKGIHDRVYELSGSDPVKISITGAELGISGAAN